MNYDTFNYQTCTLSSSTHNHQGQNSGGKIYGVINNNHSQEKDEEEQISPNESFSDQNYDSDTIGVYNNITKKKNNLIDNQINNKFDDLIVTSKLESYDPLYNQLNKSNNPISFHT